MPHVSVHHWSSHGHPLPSSPPPTGTSDHGTLFKFSAAVMQNGDISMLIGGIGSRNVTVPGVLFARSPQTCYACWHIFSVSSLQMSAMQMVGYSWRYLFSNKCLMFLIASIVFTKDWMDWKLFFFVGSQAFFNLYFKKAFVTLYKSCREV